MTTNYHTPITSGAAANAGTFNPSLASLDGQITTNVAQILANLAAIQSLQVSTMTSAYATINNGAGEADTSWAIDNISGTFLDGASVVYAVAGVVYSSEVAATTTATPLTVTAAPAVTLPDNTPIFQVPSGAAGAILQGWINVMDPAYGAAGDGITVDTTAIVAALTATAAVKGVCVFPAGHTFLTGGFDLFSDMTVIAYGAIIKHSGSGEPLISAGNMGTGDSHRNVRWYGGTLKPDTAAKDNTQALLYISGLWESTFRDIHVNGSNTDSSSVDHNSYYATYGIHVFGGPSRGNYALTIQDCHVHGCKTAGIYVESWDISTAQTYSNAGRLLGNTVERNQIALHLHSGSGWTIDSGKIENNAGLGMKYGTYARDVHIKLVHMEANNGGNAFDQIEVNSGDPVFSARNVFDSRLGLQPRDMSAELWEATTAYTEDYAEVVLPTTKNTFFYQCTVTGTSAGAEPTWPTIWRASTAYVSSPANWIVPVILNGVVFECTTAGTTGATEPTWDTTPGNTTADGTAVWTARAAFTDGTVGWLPVYGIVEHFRYFAFAGTQILSGRTTNRDEIRSRSRAGTDYVLTAGLMGEDYPRGMILANGGYLLADGIGGSTFYGIQYKAALRAGTGPSTKWVATAGLNIGNVDVANDISWHRSGTGSKNVSTFTGILSYTFTTNFAVDANQLDVTGHTLSDGDTVILTTTGTLPAGLTLNTPYHIVNSAPNVVELALTAGGAPRTLTSDGTGTHSLHTIPANSTATFTHTITGAESGDTAIATPTLDIGNSGTGFVWCAYVSATNTVTVNVGNITTAKRAPDTATWRIDVWKH